MWDNIKPELLTRLPRVSANGSTNGIHPASALARPQTEWEECFEKLEEYRSYTDDWDGQGAILGKPAKPIEKEMVDSALALAKALQRAGVLAPHWIVPGVDGTVGFDWRLADGGSISLEFIDPGSADVYFCTPQNEVEHLVLTEAVTA
jgi:hypothetical protein